MGWWMYVHKYIDINHKAALHLLTFNTVLKLWIAALPSPCIPLIVTAKVASSWVRTQSFWSQSTVVIILLCKAKLALRHSGVRGTLKSSRMKVSTSTQSPMWTGYSGATVTGKVFWLLFETLVNLSPYQFNLSFSLLIIGYLDFCQITVLTMCIRVRY